MGLSFGHLLIVVVAFLLLFGAGRLPRAMRDLGRGISEFKNGLGGASEAEEAKKKLEDAGAKAEIK